MPWSTVSSTSNCPLASRSSAPFLMPAQPCSWTVLASWPCSSCLSRFGTHSSRRRRMSHELLHVFQHGERLRLVHGWKVIEKFRERPAMFQVVDECPNRHTGSDEDGRPAENLRIRMDAGNSVRHGQPHPEASLQ